MVGKYSGKVVASRRVLAMYGYYVFSVLSYTQAGLLAKIAINKVDVSNGKEVLRLDTGANHCPTDCRWPGNLTVYLSDPCSSTPHRVAALCPAEPGSAALETRRCIAWIAVRYPTPSARMGNHTHPLSRILTHDTYHMVFLETKLTYWSSP
ncbi:hypothetical protein OUZ56_021026 [Daphnia magna]|uniref:Uncharacterized protein n=1 Tax=Daphnia magna TaxID=35525 RepID=A0ABQ9ZGV5_9CRUS|nr:hypothetical protein OUZ56_021026 [Daphnia magna]